MKVSQFYKYATWGLLALNIAVLSFFFFTRPRPPHHRGPLKHRTIKLLDLTEAQNQAFLNFAEVHKEKMNRFNEEQHDLLKLYFHSLTNEVKLTNVDSMFSKVQLLERQKIESTYQHFQEIQEMLKPEQQKGFEAFINNAIDFILLDTNKNRPKNRH